MSFFNNLFKSQQPPAKLRPGMVSPNLYASTQARPPNSPLNMYGMTTFEAMGTPDTNTVDNALLELQNAISEKNGNRKQFIAKVVDTLEQIKLELQSLERNVNDLVTQYRANKAEMVREANSPATGLSDEVRKNQRIGYLAQENQKLKTAIWSMVDNASKIKTMVNDNSAVEETRNTEINTIMEDIKTAITNINQKFKTVETEDENAGFFDAVENALGIDTLARPAGEEPTTAEYLEGMNQAGGAAPQVSSIYSIPEEVKKLDVSLSKLAQAVNRKKDYLRPLQDTLAQIKLTLSSMTGELNRLILQYQTNQTAIQNENIPPGVDRDQRLQQLTQENRDLKNRVDGLVRYMNSLTQFVEDAELNVNEQKTQKVIRDIGSSLAGLYNQVKQSGLFPTAAPFVTNQSIQQPYVNQNQRQPYVNQRQPYEGPKPPGFLNRVGSKLRNIFSRPSQSQPPYGPSQSQYGPSQSQYRPSQPPYGPSQSQYGPSQSQYRPSPSQYQKNPMKLDRRSSYYDEDILGGKLTRRKRKASKKSKKSKTKKSKRKTRKALKKI